MKKIELALADDHTLFRKALKGMLEEYDEFKVCLEAADGQELLDKLNKGTMCDVILMDIEMPNLNGAGAVKAIRKTFGDEPSVLALSMHKEFFLIQEMLESGANGFLPKEASPEELKTAIDTVLHHGFYLNPEISRHLFGGKYESEEEHEHLSENELNIIKLICDQKTNKEIATALNLSPNTINSYRTRILEKLEVVNTAGLVIYAIKSGIYQIQ